MKEIGGFIELERYTGPMLHGDGILLDSGRSCLKYLLYARQIREILLPELICDSVINACAECGTHVVFYPVDERMRPLIPDGKDDAYIYLVNYYGLIKRDELLMYRRRFPHMILDNAQDYFAEPLPDTDTLYTCRKYLGVPDGGILYTDARYGETLERSCSYENMLHLTGRLERGASEFYRQSVDNNRRLAGRPPYRMSVLTENLLHSIDYDRVRDRRTENYACLHERLGAMNLLSVNEVTGAFAYPLMLENAEKLRAGLIAGKIFVPLLWPNTADPKNSASTAYRLSAKVLPLPCDQRYGPEDMETICRMINELIGKE